VDAVGDHLNFFQKLTVQTQFGILAAQTFQLCALISIKHRASIATEATPFARRTQHPNACSPTPLGRHMRHRTAGLYHQAGSLLPNSGTNPNTFCVDITRCSAHANLCQGPFAALP